MILKLASSHMGFEKGISYKNDTLFVKWESFLVSFYNLIAKLYCFLKKLFLGSIFLDKDQQIHLITSALFSTHSGSYNHFLKDLDTESVISLLDNLKGPSRFVSSVLAPLALLTAAEVDLSWY